VKKRRNGASGGASTERDWVRTFAFMAAVGSSAACSGSSDNGAMAGNGTDGSSEAGDAGAQDSGRRSSAIAVSVEGETADSVCALTSEGGVQCWGETGNGPTLASHVPVPVPIAGLTSGVIAVSVGTGSACALTSGGGVRCWGEDFLGELGSELDGSVTDHPAPVPVTGLTQGVTAISVGGNSACAVTSGGGVRCWGANNEGQLGNGSTVASSSVPVQVTGLTSGVTAVSVGLSSACAVTAGGGVQCWGDSQFGSLGNGSTASSSVPVQVTGLTSGVTAVSVGQSAACAVTEGGGVQCWGAGWSGSNAIRSVPVPIQGLTSGVKAVSVGGTAACAVNAEDDVSCWGESASLGPFDSSVPVRVKGLASGIRAVSVGGSDSACAVTKDGGVVCWGGNDFGQLGNGGSPLETAKTPVTATGF
jgi:alpha-tubulin suppressor-like RCC1 family protein